MNEQTNKRPSMRKAINEHCKGCVYDPKAGGTWRQQTEACTVAKCPLWLLRPVSSVGKGVTDETE